MILASHQPDFFPYMGYFYKIFMSDVFVLTDDVQYSKKGRHNYNEILTANGQLKFTLPIHYHVANLNEIKIAADDRTIEKMLKTLMQSYRKAACYKEAFPIIEELLHKAPEAKNLADFNSMCIQRIAVEFGMVDKFFIHSSLLHLKERKDARIIEMCKRLNADVYISGSGAKDYHIEEDYHRNGIKLVYSDYQPVQYLQIGKQVAENMSVIDYVMNCGFRIPERWFVYE